MIKNKNIIFGLFLLIFISFFLVKTSFSDENTCAYSSKIEQCVQESKNGSPRAIEDFICINGTREEITFQIVFDEKFSEIDDEAEEYLQILEDNKDRFFGPSAQENYLQASDEVENKFSYYGEYWDKYNTLCGAQLIQEVQSCQEGKSSNKVSSDFFKDSTCMKLANTKLHIYRQVAYDILMLNKQQVRKDLAKLYVQEERTKYDELLNAMMINLGYIERIWQKWPSKIKNAYK